MALGSHCLASHSGQLINFLTLGKLSFLKLSFFIYKSRKIIVAISR